MPGTKVRLIGCRTCSCRKRGQTCLRKARWSVYIVGGRDRGDQEAYTLIDREEHRLIEVSEESGKSKE